MSPNLPTGTIAFLFTDIQGSTQLWQKHPDAMPATLAQHHALLRQAIEAHDGYVFQIIGDAFCGAFHTVRDGLQAALMAQRLLRDAEWGATGSIRVRMAMHAGAADVHLGETTSGEYVSGITLSRAARLLSAGHGGQVLLSLSAAELVLDHLPEDVSLIDLGSHRLKDLVRPEQIYQAVAPDLSVDFPPLKTLDVHPHNLPIQLTSFIGRDKDLADLSLLVGDSRLITLVGLGGAGKTRLALQLAAEHIDDFPDGAWLVDLSAIDDPRLVLQTVTATWDLPEQPGYPLAETLKDFLRHKRLLLILDNCEHLLETCAPLAHDLLLAAPELHLLATSREPLGVPGEVLYHLAALAIPDLGHLPPIGSLTVYDSVRLFIDRAQLVQPAFSLTDVNAPAVAQVCAHLDGIPLAIELAAARVRAFTPDQINARLQDRFRLLTGGSRTSLPRQQTLQATIDWSHDLLTEPERLLFRRLSVFHGGWSFEMAEAVCPGDGLEVYDLLDLLPRLVDRSLVSGDERPGGMRFHLLDTIRMYSRGKLAEAGEEKTYQARHLEAFLRLAVDTAPLLGGARQLEALQTFEGEHDNLRAALEYAIAHNLDKALRLLDALWLFWIMHGYFVEGRRWCERAIQAAEGITISDAVRSRALDGLATFLYIQGEVEPALQLSLEGLELARRAGDRRAELLHLSGVGAAQSSLGEFETARSTLEQGIELARHTQESTVLLWLLNDLANGYSAQGDLAQAEKVLEQAVVIARRLGARWELAYLLSNLASIAARIGRYDRSEALINESLPVLDQFGDRNGYSFNLFLLAKFAWRRGDPAQARKLLGESLEIERQLGRHRYVPSRVESMADFMDQQGSSRQAAILLASAQAYRLVENYPPDGEEVPDLQQVIERVRSALDDEAYGAAYAEGERLTIEQALDRVFAPDS